MVIVLVESCYSHFAHTIAVASDIQMLETERVLMLVLVSLSLANGMMLVALHVGMLVALLLVCRALVLDSTLSLSCNCARLLFLSLSCIGWHLLIDCLSCT